jgi:2-hydroxychromene-2-carboxylate isomerase
MARQPTLEFWYEFASSYSYLAAMRIEAAAEAAGVAAR